MEHRDPHAVIAEAAARLRRRHLANLFFPVVPPAIVLAVFAFSGRLPLVFVVAAAIAALALPLHAFRTSTPRLEAARRLDEATNGHDHFLTLATTRIVDSPLGELVESGAARLGAHVRPSSLPPPLRWRRIGLGVIASAVLAALLFFAPDFQAPFIGSADRLERIVNELEQSGTGKDAALANELRKLAETLRNPDATPEERRQAIEQARQELEQQEDQKGDDSGGDDGGGAGGAAAGDARGEARSELERLSGSAGGREPDSGESGEREDGDRQEPTGAGLDAPRPDSSGTSERERPEGEGNRPQASAARERQQPGTATDGEQRDPDREGEGGETQRPDLSGGSGGAGTDPSAGPPEGEPELPGEGPGWRIVDGGFVRVRVPEAEGMVLETERVTGPGEVRPTSPFGNAPLPGAGAPGEAERKQQLPLEYRSVLVPGGERTR